MNLADFDYEYPKGQVAQRPLARRDDSRMMVFDRSSGEIRHSSVASLPEFLKTGDLVVVNDSKVAPARIFGRRGTGEALEVLVIEPAESGRRGPSGQETWRCLLKKAKRIRDGEKFFFGMQATATARGRDGIFLLLEFAPGALALAMKHHGAPPLPPYIEREGLDAYTEEDRSRYQTVYAKRSGSAAAPTAGLHLSETLLSRIEGAGAKIAHVTLHVGIDTFAPVRAESLSEHRMHGERYEVSQESADEIAAAKLRGSRVVAVGTTTTRTLESAALSPGAGKETPVPAGAGVTALFITPGFEFRAVDALLTNFHQPRSTLLMMVSAFATAPGAPPMSGRDAILSAYAEAIREGYRLFSYGDCMLII
ncbi:MAG TPA: tRNA preQ1(34) S-adenosylmethionine ribosyltransferase-isomerase QueA [bacterium]|nr:tRNA preQ1(34) S-adenosylmethionine ribosyltransferase-isomerase QueA [bacterium]